jgi:formylglycine-generating enzyme required for sulfatase activity
MMWWFWMACSSPEGLTEDPPDLSLEGMVAFEASTFTMGYPDTDPGPYGNHWKETAQPAHEVSLSAFHIDAFEVTVGDWADFLGALQGDAAAAHYHPLQPVSWTDAGIAPLSGEEERPARHVSWYDAAAFCGWLGKRLPSEAEWERAARGDDPEEPRNYPWEEGGPSCTVATYYTNRTLCAEDPLPVGSTPDGDTPDGLSDMGGNVSEWVNDWYDRYTEDAVSDPRGPDSGSYKILRGGGFRETSDAMRSTDRVVADPASRSEGIGFRCAVSG